MKKEILQTAKIVFLASVLTLGVSYVSAWTGAPGVPPACPSGYSGCDAPLNVSASAQTKPGSIVTYGLGVINNGMLVFNDQLGERTQLYTGYTSGIQRSTYFFRTAQDFSFYKGGSFSILQRDPGSGGTKLLDLNGSDNKAYVNDVCIFGGSKCLSTVGGGGAAPSVSGLVCKGGVLNPPVGPWKSMLFSGQYDPGSGTDAGPAGGFLTNNSGTVNGTFYIGQRKIGYVPGTINGGSAAATITVASNGQVTVGGSGGCGSTNAGINLTYIVNY